MKMFETIKLILLLVLFLTFGNASYAGDSFGDLPESPTEKFFADLKQDLPEAAIECRTGGALSEFFNKSSTFLSGGNAYFIDKKNKEIAFFEKSVAIDQSADKKVLADIFIKIPNVQREDLVKLLLQKSVVATLNSQIIFAVTVLNSDGKEVYIYDGKDLSGNSVNPSMFTRVKKLGKVIYKGKEYITADSILKIRFPVPPKKVDENGELISVFENIPSYLICSCDNCPIHDYDLSDLKDAFDSQIVEDILKDAGISTK